MTSYSMTLWMMFFCFVFDNPTIFANERRFTMKMIVVWTKLDACTFPVFQIIHKYNSFHNMYIMCCGLMGNQTK